MNRPYRYLQGRFAALSCPDSNHPFQIGHKHLSISDAPRFRRRQDRRHRPVEVFVGKGDFDLQLRDKLDIIFRAAIKLFMPFLPPEPFDLGDGHPDDSDIGQGFLHLLKLERLDNRFNLFHCLVSSLVSTTPLEYYNWNIKKTSIINCNCSLHARTYRAPSPHSLW